VSSSAYQLDPASALAGLKTSWYSTNSALLAAHPETAEVVFANLQGQLCSGATSNVFVVLDGILHTPPLDSGCRSGVTRELLLEALADAGQPAKQTPIAFSDLQRAEELFLVSTTRQIQPAHRLEQRELPSHKPITEFAQACFDNQYRLLIDP
jgi:branched-chain amino acid aminotransferase